MAAQTLIGTLAHLARHDAHGVDDADVVAGCLIHHGHDGPPGDRG